MSDDGFFETLDQEHLLSVEAYRAIGRFVVEFEWLCSELRYAIIGLLGIETGTDASSLTEAVLGDLQPAGLLSRLRALTLASPLLGDDDRPLVKNVCGRIERIIEARNHTVHALWYLDASHGDFRGDERTSESLVQRRRRRYRHQGITSESKYLSLEELYRLVDEAEYLRGLLDVIEGLPEGYALTDYLSWDANGDARFTPGQEFG